MRRRIKVTREPSTLLHELNKGERVSHAIEGTQREEVDAFEVHVEVQEEAKVAEEEDALDHQEIGTQGIQEFFQQTHGDRNNQSFVIGATTSSRNSKSYRL